MSTGPLMVTRRCGRRRRWPLRPGPALRASALPCPSLCPWPSSFRLPSSGQLLLQFSLLLQVSRLARRVRAGGRNDLRRWRYCSRRDGRWRRQRCRNRRCARAAFARLLGPVALLRRPRHWWLRSGRWCRGCLHLWRGWWRRWRRYRWRRCTLAALAGLISPFALLRRACHRCGWGGRRRGRNLCGSRRCRRCNRWRWCALLTALAGLIGPFALLRRPCHGCGRGGRRRGRSLCGSRRRRRGDRWRWCALLVALAGLIGPFALLRRSCHWRRRSGSRFGDWRRRGRLPIVGLATRIGRCRGWRQTRRRRGDFRFDHLDGRCGRGGFQFPARRLVERLARTRGQLRLLGREADWGRRRRGACNHRPLQRACRRPGALGGVAAHAPFCRGHDRDDGHWRPDHHVLRYPDRAPDTGCDCTKTVVGTATTAPETRWFA